MKRKDHCFLCKQDIESLDLVTITGEIIEKTIPLPEKEKPEPLEIENTVEMVFGAMTIEYLLEETITLINKGSIALEKIGLDNRFSSNDKISNKTVLRDFIMKLDYILEVLSVGQDYNTESIYSILLSCNEAISDILSGKVVSFHSQKTLQNNKSEQDQFEIYDSCHWHNLEHENLQIFKKSKKNKKKLQKKDIIVLINKKMLKEETSAEFSGDVVSEDGTRYLKFDFAQKKANKLESTLWIINRSATRKLAYKFKSTNSNRYVVKESVGIINPGSETKISVCLMLSKLDSFHDLEADKYSIRTIYWTHEDTTSKNLTNVLKEREKSGTTTNFKLHMKLLGVDSLEQRVGVQQPQQSQTVPVPDSPKQNLQSSTVSDSNIFRSHVLNSSMQSMNQKTANQSELPETQDFAYRERLEEKEKQIYLLEEKLSKMEKTNKELRAQRLQSEIKLPSTKAESKGFELWHIFLVALLGMLLGQIF